MMTGGALKHPLERAAVRWDIRSNSLTSPQCLTGTTRYWAAHCDDGIQTGKQIKEI